MTVNRPTMGWINRWLLRPRVMAGIAGAVFLCIALFQLPGSPAASANFVAFTGAPPFDERPAGYTLSGVLLAFRQLGPRGLADYEAYRVVDLVFPWFLCALVAAVMLRLDAARATMWPWLAALADTAENLLQFAILLQRDDLSPELVQWASDVTQLKFVLYAIMLAMLLAVGARTLWRQHRAPH
jgi:hypothetical protein